MQKKVLLVFSLILFISLFFALPFQANAAANEVQGSPTAFLESDVYNFGSEYEGNEITHNFIIKNTGSSDLEIKNVKSG